MKQLTEGTDALTGIIIIANPLNKLVNIFDVLDGIVTFDIVES